MRRHCLLCVSVIALAACGREAPTPAHFSPTLDPEPNQLASYHGADEIGGPKLWAFLLGPAAVPDGERLIITRLEITDIDNVGLPIDIGHVEVDKPVSSNWLLEPGRLTLTDPNGIVFRPKQVPGLAFLETPKDDKKHRVRWNVIYYRWKAPV